MFSIAICDDEKYFREEIESIIRERMAKKDMLFEIDTYSSGLEFAKLGFAMKKYDVVFLDINMEKYDGIMTAQKIREISNNIFIVFITAYIDFSVHGYIFDAVRYILKKEGNLAESIFEALDTIFKKKNYKAISMDFCFIQGQKTVALDNILYIDSYMRKLTFYVMEDRLKKYLMYAQLAKIEEDLKGHDFIRIHQSHLVNMKYIEQVSRYKACLGNDIELAIAKNRYKMVEEKFVQYRGDI
ncbi:MAG: LytTR family DNA-binding domain-containing protein [Lachnospiraceae bacterium]|nr:LytTR family DNA-binding domain-containing protein [Lachnospiraceae bacterium]